MTLHPVILCGGSGTRLWPASRVSLPKQFLKLAAEHSMFQATILRLSALSVETKEPLVVCGVDHAALAQSQLAEIESRATVVVEPEGRNTAPAICLAAELLIDRDDDALLLVLPADHLIRHEAEFAAAVSTGCSAAREGRLVTFGIAPVSAHTGYGYIRSGPINTRGYAAVEAFVEKPDAELAEKFVRTGRYFWNSGMFLFSRRAVLSAFEAHAPETLIACRTAAAGVAHDGQIIRVGRRHFAAAPVESIDYAVMEAADNCVVVPMQAGWSDLGSWTALRDALPSDREGNATLGDTAVRDSRGCLVLSTSRLTVALGVQDTIVVETPDALLVCAAERAEQVKDVAESLRNAGRPEIASPTWTGGTTADLLADTGYTIQEIALAAGDAVDCTTPPGFSERLVVLSGTVQLLVDGERRTLRDVDYCVVPEGSVYRIESSCASGTAVCLRIRGAPD